MAMHHELPIHKIAFDLLSLATDITRNIPRDLKVGLGSKVRDECIEMLTLIARANSSHDKTVHIVGIIERNDTVKFLLRLFKEKRFISVKQHADSIELIESISKQANGWKKKYAASPAV